MTHPANGKASEDNFCHLRQYDTINLRIAKMLQIERLYDSANRFICTFVLLPALIY
jgi:hypothetical protein